MALDCVRSTGDNRSWPRRSALLPAPVCSLIGTSAVAAAMQAFAACKSPMLKLNACDITAPWRDLNFAQNAVETLVRQKTPCMRQGVTFYTRPAGRFIWRLALVDGSLGLQRKGRAWPCSCMCCLDPARVLLLKSMCSASICSCSLKQRVLTCRIVPAHTLFTAQSSVITIDELMVSGARTLQPYGAVFQQASTLDKLCPIALQGFLHQYHELVYPGACCQAHYPL